MVSETAIAPAPAAAWLGFLRDLGRRARTDIPFTDLCQFASDGLSELLDTPVCIARDPRGAEFGGGLGSLPDADTARAAEPDTDPLDPEPSTIFAISGAEGVWGYLALRQQPPLPQFAEHLAAQTVELLGHARERRDLRLQRERDRDRARDLLSRLANRDEPVDRLLRDCERSFRALFARSERFACLLSPEGIVLAANDAALACGAITPEAALGRPLWTAPWWVRPLEVAALRAAVGQAARGEIVRYGVVGGPGAIAVELSLRPLHDEGGTVAAVVTEGVEVGARGRARPALLSSEEIFRTLCERSPAGIYLIDSDGCITYINPRACEIFGCDADTALAVGWQAFVHPDDHDRFGRDLDPTGSELQFRRSDGSTCWVCGRHNPLHGPDGELLGYVGTLEDITARKQVEQAWQQLNRTLEGEVDARTSDLQAANARLAAEAEERQRLADEMAGQARVVDSILSATPDGVCLFDRGGRILYLNAAAARLIDLGASQAIGRSLAEVPLALSFGQGSAVEWDAVFVAGKTLRGEYSYFDERGGRRTLEYALAPLLEPDGSINSAVASYRDISQRRQIEAHLRAAIDTVPGLVSWIDANGTYLGVNRRLADRYGLSPADFVGRPVGFLLDDSPVVQFARQFVASDRARASQIVADELPSDPRTYLVVAQRYQDGEAAIVVGIDITERQQAEIALRESEEKFRQVTEHIQDVFWIFAPDRRKAFYVSPAYATIWGQSCRDLYEAPDAWLQAVHPGDRDRVRAALASPETGHDLEYRIRRPDGVERWIRDRAFPIADDRARVLRVAGIAQDITPRKRAAARQQQLSAELRAQACLLDAVLAASVDCITVTDRSDRFVYANPAALELYGCTRAEAIGKTSSDLGLPPAAQVELDCARRHALACQQPIGGAIAWPAANGSTRAFDYVIAPLTGDDERTVTVARDVTEHLYLQSQLAASEERFRTSVENMLDCFEIYSPERDADGRVVNFRLDYVNAATCEQTGTDKTELIGRCYRELPPQHRPSGLFADYCRLADTGDVLVYDGYRDPGDRRAYDIRAVRLDDGIAVVWRDVTGRQQQAEQLRTSLLEKDTLHP